MNAAVANDALAPYGAAFEAVRATVGETAAAREQAFARFAELGFPAPRDEAWKYTSLRRLEARRFAFAGAGGAGPVDTPAVDALSSHRVTVVNGRVTDAALVRSAPLDGIRVRTLSQALEEGEPQGALLRVPTGGGTERFAALNAALSNDAVVIDVAASASVAEPLHVVIAAAGAEPTMIHPRLLIRAGAGSSARIVLHHVGTDSAEHFVNSYVDVEAAADAQLHLYRLQSQGARAFLIERIDATVGQRAAIVVHDAQLGASLSRLDLNARLAAPGAAAELTGLFLADDSRHLDAHVRVDHLAAGTRSLVDYRGIAAGRGRGVFNGKAVVHVDAQQSQARQTSRNLLLTPGAEIDTKPELEIYADDVQCSHGATTGQLDPAALFYLRSRGLDERQARSALTRAFAGAVLSRMDLASYSGAVHSILDARLERLLETTA
ncbi:MAG: Fe-S cluster assembly protein SufD [Gammaproteobacteria bacterium]|nr:Fe-S cluster assembly protein SufD [Gammaproteobacteria bacterium]